jgi:hypothetical protein
MRCVGSSDNASCKGRMFPFSACETALVYELAHRTQRSIGADFFREQSDRREQIEQEIASNTERQQKLLEVAALAEGVEVVAKELKRLQVHIDTLETELKSASAFPLSQREMHENAALFGVYLRLTEKEFADWNPYGDTTATITEFRQKLKVILARTLKRIEFKNGKSGAWSPQLILTYVSDKTAVVDVTRYLPERTQQWIANGTYHRSDLGKTRKPSSKKSG